MQDCRARLCESPCVKLSGSAFPAGIRLTRPLSGGRRQRLFPCGDRSGTAFPVFLLPVFSMILRHNNRIHGRWNSSLRTFVIGFCNSELHETPAVPSGIGRLKRNICLFLHPCDFSCRSDGFCKDFSPAQNQIIPGECVHIAFATAGTIILTRPASKTALNAGTFSVKK